MGTNSSDPPLHYGLTVRAIDLVAAGETVDRVGPALHAIRLISCRRERGTLSFEGNSSSAVGNVPAEVWLMVRGWILHRGLKSARVGIMEALSCAKCEEAAVRAKTRALEDESKRLKLAHKGRAGHEGAEKDPWREVQADECQYRAWSVWANNWPSYAQPGSCDHVSEGASRLREARKRWFGAELVAQPVKDLLRDYGLALVATHAPQSPANHSLLAVTATIAIPRPDMRAPALPSQASHSGTDSDSDSPGEQDGLAAGPSAPAAFRLPDDTDGRFRRFRRDFAVGCVPRGVSTRKRGESKEERTRRREAAAAEARQASFFRAGADSVVLDGG